MAKSWSAVDGTILFNGQGSSLCTEKQYGNFEMYVGRYSNMEMIPDTRRITATDPKLAKSLSLIDALLSPLVPNDFIVVRYQNFGKYNKIRNHF